MKSDNLDPVTQTEAAEAWMARWHVTHTPPLDPDPLYVPEEPEQTIGAFLVVGFAVGILAGFVLGLIIGAAWR